MYTKIPSHILDDIKRRVSLVDVIARYGVELKRAGRNFKGLCPFHNESAPSFTVSEDSGYYHCFGCTAHGDAFSFIKEKENLTWIESVKLLAKEAGVELPEIKQMTKAQKQTLDEKDQMFEFNSLAGQFFQQQLIEHKNGKFVQDYLKDRGVKREMIEAFRIGYAPDSWNSLLKHLGKTDSDQRLLARASLIKQGSKDNHYYDVFRHRLIFPFIMENDRIVGFGGRALKDDEPAKYLNSPESPLFSKKRTLYGYHKARQAIRKKDRAIIVEGNMDVVMMHQHGFDETVAMLGTALSENHLQLIRRMTKNIIIICDGDQAGRTAMLKPLSLCLTKRINARAVVLPDSQDPDSFLVSNGREALLSLIDNSRYLFDIWLEDKYLNMRDDPRGVSDCLHSIIPMLAIVETVERSLYIQKIAERLKIDHVMVLQLLRQYANKKNWEKLPADSLLRSQEQDSLADVFAAEEMLLGLLIHYPKLVYERFVAENIKDKIKTSELKELSGLLLDWQEEGSSPDFNKMIDQVADKKWKNRIAKLLINSEGLVDLTDEVVLDSLNDCLLSLTTNNIEEEIKQLDAKIKGANNLDDNEKIRLQMRRNELYGLRQQMKITQVPD